MLGERVFSNQQVDVDKEDISANKGSGEVVTDAVFQLDFEIDDGLEQSEVATLIATAIFQKFDADKSKTLDLAEAKNFFVQLLRLAGITENLEARAQAMSDELCPQIDANNDGQLSLQEVESCVLKFLQAEAVAVVDEQGRELVKIGDEYYSPDKVETFSELPEGAVLVDDAGNVINNEDAGQGPFAALE